jgi:hypothetical protein
MPETLTITKEQLRAVFLDWEMDYREGRTLTVEEALAKPVDQVVGENTDNVWAALSAQVNA